MVEHGEYVTISELGAIEASTVKDETADVIHTRAASATRKLHEPNASRWRIKLCVYNYISGREQ